MNNMKTTEEMIKVMQAFVDGKTIECNDPKGDGQWETVTRPLWNWFYIDYRIKSEPREFWLYAHMVFTSAESAWEYREMSELEEEEIIHVREVL